MGFKRYVSKAEALSKYDLYLVDLKKQQAHYSKYSKPWLALQRKIDFVTSSRNVAAAPKEK